MNREKLNRRARALAAHASGEGNEAETAARMLADLVEQHPELSHWLDEGAAEAVDVEFDAPTHGHRIVLAEFCFRHRCEAFLEPVGGSSMVRVRVQGERARVRKVAEEYEPHARSLTLLFEALGEVYLDEAVPAMSDEEVEALLDEMNDEELEDLLGPPPEQPRPEPSEEAKRLERARGSLPGDAIRRACQKLVRLSRPAREDPAFLLGAVSRRWDAPEMSYGEFLLAYRDTFPDGTLPEYRLAQKYRDGFRIYPPTRGWRLVEPVANPEGPLPELPGWWPDGEPSQGPDSSKKRASTSGPRKATNTT